MDWYFVDRNRERQPFDEADLGDRVKDGTIGPGTLLWNESMDDWAAAAALFPAWFPGETVPMASSSPVTLMEEAPPTPPSQESEKTAFSSLEDVPAKPAPGSGGNPESRARPSPRVVRKAPAGDFDRVEMIKDFASYLSANRGWIKFFGVISIIQGSLLCLSVGGALVGWLPIWLGVTVFRSARAAELAERSGSQEYLEEALYRLGFFFKLNGIVVVVIAVFFAIVIAVVIATGLFAAVASRVPTS